MMRVFVCCLGLVLGSASLLLADELRTLGAKTVAGQLWAISESEITLKTDDGTAATPLAQALLLDLRPIKGAADAKYTEVRLLDDSVLLCQSVAFEGNDVNLVLLSGASVKVPLSVVTWLLQEAQDQALHKKFDDILTQKSKRDRIVVLRDTDLNALEGTLGDVDAKGTTIQFRRDGADAVGILFERLHGLIFYRTEIAGATPRCRVYDTDGNLLLAVKIAMAEGSDDCQLTTSFGTKVALKKEHLAKLDFNIGKLTYLSDMEPAKVVERSGIGLITHYRKDANLDGEPILLEKQHAKGLSLHAHTELSYQLAGKYKDFKAHLGVDGRTGSDSQALVTIYCDGDKRFSEVVTVKTSRDIALSVKDVQTLRIVVSSRNFLDLHDHATLADARVSQ
jgi:hypothetical protein